MGGGSSAPSPPPARAPTPPPPPPPPLFDKPWRTISWGDNKSTIERLKQYKPPGEGQQLRVLLHGAIGAGKSSFINSIKTVLNGRIYRGALASNVSEELLSFTREYTTYKIQQERGGGLCSFVFNDIMGMESNQGIHKDDIKLALRGRVKEGYRFNPASPLSENDQFYNGNPTNNDKVHVLVCVVDANNISALRDGVVEKIKNVREEASRLGIPQMAVLTKIDEFSEIKRNLQNIYKDKSLKKQMEEFSQRVGIPMNCIFPLKNYHEEIDLNNDINSLILSALESIINFGDDFITDTTVSQ